MRGEFTLQAAQRRREPKCAHALSVMLREADEVSYHRITQRILLPLSTPAYIAQQAHRRWRRLQTRLQ